MTLRFRQDEERIMPCRVSCESRHCNHYVIRRPEGMMTEHVIVESRRIMTKFVIRGYRLTNMDCKITMILVHI